MAMASNFLEEAVLNYFFRKQTVDQPNKVYLALYLNDPTDANTGTEVNGGAYVRQEVTFNAPTQVSDKATITNNNKIEFPIATGNWGDITHWGLLSTQSGGNLLCRGAFTKTETLNQGNRFTVEPDNLKVIME